MENTGQNHKTRLFISDDSPQQGANVPQGYQHLARHARSLYVKNPFTAGLVEAIQFLRGGVSPYEALSIADQPASKEMLVNFIDGNNNIVNSVHAQWQADLKTLGYPHGFSGTPFRFVAVSNGSECAYTQGFSPGGNLLTFYGKGNTRILGDVLGNIAFPVAGVLLNQPALILGVLPGRNDFNFDFSINAQADGASNQVYRGKIIYTKKVLWLLPITSTITNRSYNSNAATLPYDYFPGGYYDLRTFGLDLNSAEKKNFFIKYKITAYDQPTFCFVPTVSALDIGSNNVSLTKSDYLTRYVGATPPATPKNTPFQNFIIASNNSKNSEQHISIETRNGNWMAAELTGGTAPAANCTAFCGVDITGSDNVCSSGTYSVPALSGATYSWTASPSGIVTITNPNSNSITVTKSGQRTVTLTANITENNCLQGTLSLTKSITVSSPPDNYYISNIYVYPNPPAIDIYTSSSGNSQVVTSWSISVSGGGYKSDSGYPPAVTTADGGSGCGYHTVTLTTNNSCGSYSTSSSFTRPGCRIFHLSPNPASGSVIIDDEVTDKKTILSVGKVIITVFDGANRPLKQFSFTPSSQYRFSVADLMPGAYNVQIKTNNEITNLKLLKK